MTSLVVVVVAVVVTVIVVVVVVKGLMWVGVVVKISVAVLTIDSWADVVRVDVVAPGVMTALEFDISEPSK